MKKHIIGIIFTIIIGLIIGYIGFNLMLDMMLGGNFFASF